MENRAKFPLCKEKGLTLLVSNLIIQKLAETERFELSYAGEGVTAFRVRLVATTSIRFHIAQTPIVHRNPTRLFYYII